MEAQLVLCADSCTIDQTSGQLSIFNLIEDISSPVFPLAVPVTFVAVMKRTASDPAQATVQIRFVLDGQNSPLFDAPASIDFLHLYRNRLVARIQAVVISGPGTLKASLVYKKKELGHWVINVMQTASPISVSGGAPSMPASTSKSVKKKKAKKRR